jgi:hypothetical protein
MRVRMELFAEIRRDARVEGLSIRALAKRHRIGRDTVRQALSDPVPPARKTPVRASPRLDRFKAAIDAMLIEDKTAPRKQRHTARRILARLIEEHGAEEGRRGAGKRRCRRRPLLPGRGPDGRAERRPGLGTSRRLARRLAIGSD